METKCYGAAVTREENSTAFAYMRTQWMKKSSAEKAAAVQAAAVVLAGVTVADYDAFYAVEG